MRSPQESGHGARFPILQGILPIQKSQLAGEVFAGVTLAALAIPEVMGYTKISGTPVITGLYTILIPTVLFALFGSSRHLVVGADSATAAILAAAMIGIAKVGSDEYVALASLLALMTAVLLILARIARIGFLADFLSRTVLIGFLTGVGIQVAIGEVAGILGVPSNGHRVWEKVTVIFRQIDQINFYSLGIALAVLAVIVGFKRISKKIPGALISVIGAIALSWAFDLQRYVTVLGVIPSGLPTLGLPQVDWSFSLISSLTPTAISMFVVIIAQSAATSRAYAARYDERFREDVDLVGLALANVGAGLSGAFVVNGSPTKTQMVDSAGGRTQLSLLVMALIVLLVLLFLTQTFALMPSAVLSAIVFLVGFDLIDLRGMCDIYRRRRAEFWIASITALAVVFVGVEQGVLLAMALSLISHTRHGYRPRNAVLVPTESGVWRTQPVETRAEALPGLIIYRFTHSIYYANAQQLSDEIAMLSSPQATPLKWLCMEASAIDDVDYTAAETLNSIVLGLKEQGVRMVVVQEMLEAPGHGLGELQALLGADAYYDSLDEVLADYRRQTGAASE